MAPLAMGRVGNPTLFIQCRIFSLRKAEVKGGNKRGAALKARAALGVGSIVDHGLSLASGDQIVDFNAIPQLK